MLRLMRVKSDYDWYCHQATSRCILPLELITLRVLVQQCFDFASEIPTIFELTAPEANCFLFGVCIWTILKICVPATHRNQWVVPWLHACTCKLKREKKNAVIKVMGCWKAPSCDLRTWIPSALSVLWVRLHRAHANQVAEIIVNYLRCNQHRTQTQSKIITMTMVNIEYEWDQTDKAISTGIACNLTAEGHKGSTQSGPLATMTPTGPNIRCYMSIIDIDSGNFLSRTRWRVFDTKTAVDAYHLSQN